MFGEWNVEDWKVIPNEARPGIRLWLPCAAVDKHNFPPSLVNIDSLLMKRKHCSTFYF